MSRQRSNTEVIATKAQLRQEALKRAAEIAEGAKKHAIKEATKPMGLCLFITVFILVAVIAPPLAIVLL